MDLLCYVDALSIGQSSINGSSSGGSQGRVKCIDVKAEMDWSLFPDIKQIAVINYHSLFYCDVVYTD